MGETKNIFALCLNLPHAMPRRFTRDHPPKKREMRLNISQRLPQANQKINGNCQHIISKKFCEQVVDTGRLLGTILAPRHD